MRIFEFAYISWKIKCSIFAHMQTPALPVGAGESSGDICSKSQGSDGSGCCDGGAQPCKWMLGVSLGPAAAPRHHHQCSQAPKWDLESRWIREIGSSLGLGTDLGGPPVSLEETPACREEYQDHYKEEDKGKPMASS